jgi:hypothetical protein
MKPLLQIGASVALVGLSMGCHRTIYQDEEPPVWLFDVYSDRTTSGIDPGSVTRYIFHEDNRVDVERDSSCGGGHEAWELEWEITGPGALTLSLPDGAAPTPDSGFASQWWVRFSDECDALELGFIRVGSGESESLGALHRGAVCGEPVPPPDDWGGGQWDECAWDWCNAPPMDGCQ